MFAEFVEKLPKAMQDKIALGDEYDSLLITFKCAFEKMAEICNDPGFTKSDLIKITQIGLAANAVDTLGGIQAELHEMNDMIDALVDEHERANNI